MAKKTDIRLGQLLVQRKLCTLRGVNEALLEQRSRRTRSESAPLGRILVEMEAVDEEALCEVLAEMGVLTLWCPACRTSYPLETYARGVRPSCSGCGGELVLGDHTEAAAPDPARSGGIEIRNVSRPPRQDPTPATPARGGDEDPPPDCSDYTGRVFGGCQLLEKIAHGGMGIVYRAKQLNLGRIVAVKVLAQDLANDATFVRRFVQEARSAAQLSHGNIVHINDVGECQGIFYFVMEYIDGKNLKEIMKEKERLEIEESIDIITQVSQALRHAHSRGIIHRDIKPENIMITRDGVVKLADLGLAKRVATENSLGLTHAGAILGTPFYMAPEQAKDFSKVDRRSDIYSLGVTLYRMLTGKVPFDGRSPIEVMIKAIDGKKIPIRELREEVTPQLEQIVDRMMHRAPDSRYQEVGEVVRDLTRVANEIAVSETS